MKYIGLINDKVQTWNK